MIEVVVKREEIRKKKQETEADERWNRFRMEHQHPPLLQAQRECCTD